MKKLILKKNSVGGGGSRKFEFHGVQRMGRVSKPQKNACKK